MLNNFCHVLSPFSLACMNPWAKFVLRELLLRIIYVFLNKNFSRNNNFSVCCCIIILSLITLTQNTILRQQHQVEFNTSHINTRIASVNVGKFFIGFLLLGSVFGHFLICSKWILFESMFFWLFQIRTLSLLHRGSLKYCFYFENSRSFKWVKSCKLR